MGAVHVAKHEWRHFRSDRPGHRFRNHRHRMKQRPKRYSVVAVAVGVVLIASGIVLLFVPGPGSVVIAFGLALLASQSRRLAHTMDRAEPALRRTGKRIEHWWSARSTGAKTWLIAAATALVAVAMLGMWKFVVSAYLLG
jgi:hypothetical protein